MAYTTINKHTDYFNTVLYTGNATDNRTVTGVGFQPDWLWIKNRADTEQHRLQDAVRGATKNLKSSGNGAEETTSNTVKSFDSDGFTLGVDNAINGNSDAMVSWNWKAGTTGSGTTSGSGYGKAYSYSVNTAAGFSIITYKGNGSAGHAIPHHLGATPSFIIVKNRDAAQSWLVGTTQLGWTKNLHLNETGAVETTTNIWNDTAPTSSVFTVGTNTKCNTDDEDYIAYVFAEKVGYSKFGSYVGNGNNDGTFVYTGFKPAFIMIKCSSDSNNWVMLDNKRDGYNPDNNRVYADVTNAEDTTDNTDILSNGFKSRFTGATSNGANKSYIYMAFGQPIVSSTNIIANAR